MVDIESTVELQAEIQRAREVGATLDATEPRAVDAWSDAERIPRGGQSTSTA